MKKRIAWLLTLILFISGFQGATLYATPESDFLERHEYKQTTEGLYEKSGEGLIRTPITSDAEEAAFTFKMNPGEYTFSYDVISSTAETRKVKTTFEVSAGDVKLKAEYFKDGISELTNFSRHVFPYTGTWDKTKDTKFEAELALNPLVAEKRELSLQIDNTNIRFYIEKDTIHIWTDNISRGYITDFTLQYGAGGVASQSTIRVLNGIRKFEILPTHLREGTLNSLNIIEAESGIEAGSKPGVKISFEKPYIIDGTTFRKLNNTELQNTETVLAIWGEQRPGVKDESVANNERNFAFKLNNDASIKDTVTNQEVGKVIENMDNINIYLSKEPPSGGKVIDWDTLEPSMLLGAKMEMAGATFTGIKNVSFKPQNNGHTYLKYKAYRASEQQICIEILPYNINGPVTYTIKERIGGGTGGSFENIVTRLHNGTEENKNQVLSIYIPITKADVYYQVEADIGTSDMLQSQQLGFKPSNEIAPPPITQIIRANNIYVVPGEAVEGRDDAFPQAIGFDLEWSAPNSKELNAILDKGDIFYELNLYNKKKEDPKQTKIFRIYKDTSVTTGSAIQVELYGGTKIGQKGKYNPAIGTFEMDNIIIQNAGQIKWESIHLPVDRFENKEDYINDADILKGVNDLEYYIPGTYYLSMNGVFDPKELGEHIAVSKESALVSIALDEVIEVIEVPTRITHKDTSTDTTVKQDIYLNKVDISTYVKKMLEPAHIYLYDMADEQGTRLKGTYEIFLYQKTKESDKYSEVDFSAAMEDANTPHKKVDSSNNSIDLKNDLDYLRAGKIIPIEYTVDKLDGIGEDLKLSLENLDNNQVYYISTRVRLNPWKLNEDGSQNNSLKPRYSIYSKLHSFTTKAVPQPPRPEDKVPPAPGDFKIESQPNNTTVILQWEKAEFEEESSVSKVYYEIAKVPEKELNTEELKNTLSIDDLIDSNKQVVGFRTKNANMETKDAAIATWEELEPTQASDSFKLKDMNLLPNSLYYYYVRTVCIIDGKEVYSQWLKLPVTTNPVDKPIKLKVESPKNYDYDEKKSVVVSFIAPIPKDATVPQDYDFEIAVQGEKDSEYRLDYNTRSLTSKEKPELVPAGYRHFVYEIYDLKPNQRYDIKVRVVDKTHQPGPNEEYPRSLYSDKVVFRTEFDEEEQEKNEAYEEYLKKFDDAVEKLRRRAYWVAESGKHTGVYKYRESYINTELAAQGEYTLIGKEDADTLQYYLPANMLEVASDNNVILQVKIGDHTLHIRTNTLTDENEAIEDAIEAIEENRIEDYYLLLEFSTKNFTGTINGEKVISPEFTIDMEIVYMEEEDCIIEDDIMIALNSIIDKERKRFIDDLEDELEDGRIEADVLERLIEDALEDIEEDHQDDVDRILDKKEDRKKTVYEIEKNFLITSKLQAYAVNGYYDNHSWEMAEVFVAGGIVGMEGTKLGTYIFTEGAGFVNQNPALGKYQGFISKYQLGDFFVLDTYSMQKNATKKQLYGSLARVLGAKRGSDYSLYLKSRGIKGINTIGVELPVRQDEAIYIVMQGYEKMYHRNIRTIAIKNKQSVQNIGAFQMHYRPYAYAAVELKIVENPGAKVIPSRSLSAKTLLEMLWKVTPK